MCSVMSSFSEGRLLVITENEEVDCEMAYCEVSEAERFPAAFTNAGSSKGWKDIVSNTKLIQ